MQKFVTQAQTSYGGALKDPYAGEFAKYGYPAATLKTLIANVQKLNEARSKHNQAHGAAKAATVARDDAYLEFKQWVVKFKGISEVALRRQPGLLMKLGL